MNGASTGGITLGAKSVIADYTIVRKVVVNRDFAGSVVDVARGQQAFQEIFLGLALYVVVFILHDVEERSHLHGCSSV